MIVTVWFLCSSYAFDANMVGASHTVQPLDRTKVSQLRPPSDSTSLIADDLPNEYA